VVISSVRNNQQHRLGFLKVSFLIALVEQILIIIEFKSSQRYALEGKIRNVYFWLKGNSEQ